MGPQRPTGVTILAIIWFLGSLLLLVGGMGLLTVGALVLGPVAMVLGALLLVLGLFGFFVGWGLWGLKPWARKLAMILALVNIAVTIYNVVRGSWGDIFTIVIYAIVLFYLTRPGVRAAFESAHKLGAAHG